MLNLINGFLTGIIPKDCSYLKPSMCISILNSLVSTSFEISISLTGLSNLKSYGAITNEQSIYPFTGILMLLNVLISCHYGLGILFIYNLSFMFLKS